MKKENADSRKDSTAKYPVGKELENGNFVGLIQSIKEEKDKVIYDISEHIQDLQTQNKNLLSCEKCEERTSKKHDELIIRLSNKKVKIYNDLLKLKQNLEVLEGDPRICKS